MSSSTSHLKVVGVNIAILLVGLVVVELFFGTWFSQTHALYQFTKPRNVNLDQPNALPVGRPRIRYVRDGFGFRGLDAKVSEIDIITVGGSTTDQRLLDEEETYQSEMKRLAMKDGKRLVIANAGIDGQTTIGHIHNFSSWFNSISGLKAKYILFYIGINDLLRLDNDVDEVHDATAPQSPLLRLQLWVRDKSVIYQSYLIVKRGFSKENHRVALDASNFAIGDGLVEKGVLDQKVLTVLNEKTEPLVGRVAKLAALSREMNAKPIFVTQRSNRWDRRDRRIFGKPSYKPDYHERAFKSLGAINGVDIHNIERMVADAVLRGCRRETAICIDLFDEVEFDNKADFYDTIHTTASGSRKIGEYLYKRLGPLLGNAAGVNGVKKAE